MKKSIICGIASLAIATTPVFGAFATDIDITGDATKDVTVGEVDETIYSVDINWGDMVFDWKYDTVSNSFNFANRQSCVRMMGTTAGVQDYKDDACTELHTFDEVYDGPLYAKIATGNINVIDDSINGKIKANASFTPNANYSWSVGKFYEYATINTASGEIEYTNELPDGLAAHYAGVAPQGYSGYLKLEKSQDAKVATESINPNDKIGTVTITIEPDLNENVSE